MRIAERDYDHPYCNAQSAKTQKFASAAFWLVLVLASTTRGGGRGREGGRGGREGGREGGGEALLDTKLILVFSFGLPSRSWIYGGMM